ncbi:MAG: dihydrolipoamide succinyltransferase, partial [Candidatus Hydrogenedentes bacterium]|nr:dihydrolipoamide succinyltransferase [Candidatus Hydrogenedentota bacterium]
MPVELIVPPMGESITEVQIGAWRKQPGDPVNRDEPVVEIESDKATVDLPAPVSGAVVKVLKKEGERATVGEVIGYMDESASTATTAPAAPAPSPKPAAPAPVKPVDTAARVMPS